MRISVWAVGSNVIRDRLDPRTKPSLIALSIPLAVGAVGGVVAALLAREGFYQVEEEQVSSELDEPTGFVELEAAGETV
jgi:hypothetical protein